MILVTVQNHDPFETSITTPLRPLVRLVTLGHFATILHDFKFDKNSRMLLKGFKSCNMGLKVKLVL